jgi:hypothetical protein
MKYKVGDYIAGDATVCLLVKAAIDGDMPLYGLHNHKNDDVAWFTEWELDDSKMAKVTPDFELWDGVKAGDMIHIGHSQDRPYLKVLARVGDLVMTSQAPAPQSIKTKINALASQLEDLTDGVVTQAEVKRSMPVITSTMQAHRTAHAKWLTTEELALMNWELLRE